VALAAARQHLARAGSERNRSEWGTLLLHMRVQANLLPEDAEAPHVFLHSSP